MEVEPKGRSSELCRWIRLDIVGFQRAMVDVQSRFPQGTTMRFYSPGRILSALLLLVVLTCVAQGASLRAKRSFLDGIRKALNDTTEKIKDTMKTVESMFGPSRDPETVTPQPNETSTMDPRHIIHVPIRCPPDHVIVNQRCRLMQK